MTLTPASRRQAFTLIELLVVIAIIALLAALTAGAYSRIQASQAKSATDATLAKINSLIERRWNAVLGQVSEDVKNNHPGYAAVLGRVQNPDLAKAIWTHAKMKNEFPMSFNEARTATVIFTAAEVPPAGVFIPAKSMFSALPVGAVGGTPEESAACLYLAVMANAGGGTAAESDGVQQQTGTTTTGAKCFKDSWGEPIAFVRTVYNAEVNQPPFVPVGKPAHDPFDFAAIKKLGAFATANPTWWANTRAPVSWVNIPTTYPTTGNNFLPTAISGGSNRQFWGQKGLFNSAATDIYGLDKTRLGPPPNPYDSDTALDNHLSYRLRREGARGD